MMGEIPKTNEQMSVMRPARLGKAARLEVADEGFDVLDGGQHERSLLTLWAAGFTAVWLGGRFSVRLGELSVVRMPVNILRHTLHPPGSACCSAPTVRVAR